MTNLQLIMPNHMQLTFGMQCTTLIEECFFDGGKGTYDAHDCVDLKHLEEITVANNGYICW